MLNYTPSPEALDIAKQNYAAFSAPKRPIVVASGEFGSDLLVTFPLNTTATSGSFLQPKYPLVRTITFEGFGLLPDDINGTDDILEALRDLPSGFVKDPYFGLGINYEFRYLINAIEELDDVTDLRIRRGRSADLPKLDGKSYLLSAAQFDTARKTIGRLHAKALKIASTDKKAFVHNALLTPIDEDRFPQRHRPYKKDAIAEALSKTIARTTTISKNDRETVIVAATTAVKAVNKSDPEALFELNREIEVVTLEELIERIKKMLEKQLSEDAWQKFFVENPFVLKLAFGLPIVMVGREFSVGGGKFSGSGEKISDFAVRAAASGNLSLVEIKKPDTAILETGPYRREVYAPSRELSGAVNQLLDQRYQLQKSITQLKDASRTWDVESYAIQGVVIAGRTPTEPARLKSFELFRNGLKSITVVTFDELLTKLEHLLEVLRAPPPSRDS